MPTTKRYQYRSTETVLTFIVTHKPSGKTLGTVQAMNASTAMNKAQRQHSFYHPSELAVTRQ